MKKYRAITYLRKVEPVEVQKETEKFVVLANGRKESKITENVGYFDTWKEAKAFMIDRVKTNIQQYARYIKRENEELAKIEALKEERIMALVDEIKAAVPVSFGYIDISWGLFHYEQKTTQTQISAHASVTCYIQVDSERVQRFAEPEAVMTFTLVHEFMHYIHAKAAIFPKLWSDVGAHSFFDRVSVAEFVDELKDMDGFCKKKSHSILGHDSVLSPDIREQIANLGTCLYLWTAETAEAFPLCSARFIELLVAGYYGDEARNVLRSVLD